VVQQPQQAIQERGYMNRVHDAARAGALRAYSRQRRTCRGNLESHARRRQLTVDGAASAVLTGCR
jgi:hypothetical protein